MSIKSYLKRGLIFIIKGTPVKNIVASISYLLPNERLKGKKIIITGGGRGLGLAMAKKFIAEGADVLIAGRNEKMLYEQSQIIGCKYLHLDVQNVNSFDDFLQHSSELLNGLTTLVNNAGISLHEGNIRNVTVEQFNDQIDTNLRGGYFLSQKFIHLLEVRKQQQHGDILFVSSERGFYVDDLPYGLTKAAMNSLTQGLAKRIISSGIRVNAVAPGVTTSDMTGFKADENLYCDYNATERVYLPEEVAEVACFLLSDASACLSGQILICNEAKSVNSHWK